MSRGYPKAKFYVPKEGEVMKVRVLCKQCGRKAAIMEGCCSVQCVEALDVRRALGEAVDWEGALRHYIAKARKKSGGRRG